MKRWRRMTFCLLIAAIAAWGWFAPSGTGECADSPDGRYRACASNNHRGTWLHGRVASIDVEIVENATGNLIWKARRFPLATETPPAFDDRSKKFIHWSPDSRSVSVPVGGSTDAVWAVP
jgi:hypothetical protein